MIVDELRSRELNRDVERSARVRWKGGEFRVRIRVPATFAGPPGDASSLLAALLLVAMGRREDLELDGTVSALLLERSESIQAIYASWNPSLRRCRVRATAAPCQDPEEPSRIAEAGAACFFSRGVDSTFSAATGARRGALEHLVFADWTDPHADSEMRASERHLAQEAAKVIGLPLVIVETNMRELSQPLFDWEDAVGAGLAFVAHSLSAAIRRAIVPSTDSYLTLEPCGTSPLLDPLFSTEAVTIEHDVLTEGRVAKVTWLARERPELLRRLKVCYAESRVDNCGRCGKCLYTMVALEAAGVLEQAEGFPDRVDPEAFARLRFDSLDWAPRLGMLEVCRALGPDGSGGVTPAAMLRFLRVRGRQADPHKPKPPLTFRRVRAKAVLSLLRDGRPFPPLDSPGATGEEDDERPGQIAGTPPGESWSGSRGLVRTLDRAGQRHLYGAGGVPPGKLIGELGSLADRPGEDPVPVWLAEEGYVFTDRYRPSPRRPSAVALVRWVLAPLSWRGFSSLRIKAGAVVWRMRALARERPEASELSGIPVGFLSRVNGSGRSPLYAAIHPVTGDQLLSTSRWEANDMGYVDGSLIGYLDAVAAVTGRLGTTRPKLLWASRFGQQTREDPRSSAGP